MSGKLVMLGTRSVERESHVIGGVEFRLNILDRETIPGWKEGNTYVMGCPAARFVMLIEWTGTQGERYCLDYFEEREQMDLWRERFLSQVAPRWAARHATQDVEELMDANWIGSTHWEPMGQIDLDELGYLRPGEAYDIVMSDYHVFRFVRRDHHSHTLEIFKFIRQG